jgi:hypothetical protein
LANTNPTFITGEINFGGDKGDQENAVGTTLYQNYLI